MTLIDLACELNNAKITIDSAIALAIHYRFSVSMSEQMLNITDGIFILTVWADHDVLHAEM